MAYSSYTIGYSLLRNHTCILQIQITVTKVLSNTLQPVHVILHLYVYKYYFYIHMTVNV